jgi:hypothetical protein
MPEVTAVLARAMVPAVVIVPPLRPVPAAIEVTVPELVLEMVIFPVDDEILIPDPATRLRTPELVTVTLPVFPLTLIPVPAKTPDTAPAPPVVLMVAVAGLTLSPEPTIKG